MNFTMRAHAPLIAGVLGLGACGDSDEQIVDPNATVLDTIDERPELSTLRALIDAAGIEDQLSDPTAEITVFAPPDSAFDALPSELVAYLEANPDVLADVLLYHVALERRGVGGLNPIDDEELLTAEGGVITVIGTQPRLIQLEDATGAVFGISNGDITAGRSVVHVIDGVMLPREIEVEPPLGNLVEVAMDAGQFGVLLSAAQELTVGGRAIADILQDAEPQTLFAPTDDAFGDLGVDLTGLTNDTDLGDVVTNLLLAHVAMGDRSSEQLRDAGFVNTRARLSFDFVPGTDTMPATVGGAAIASNDVAAANGRIHVLDEVILPPTVLEVATSTPGLSTLANAVTDDASPRIREALAPDALAGERPITVFAPDDQAFMEADLGPEDLDRVLAFHVVEGQLTFDDFVGTPDGTELETLDGEVLTVRNDGTSIQLEDARGNRIEILAGDVRASNGVVHIVDRVLLPPLAAQPDLIDAATDLSEDPTAGFGLDTLLLAASGLDLDGAAIAVVLRGPGPFTLFAPTDAAFQALGLDLTNLNTDEDLQAVVSNVLLTHVAGESLFAADLAQRGAVDTLGKTSLSFDEAATPPTIGGAAIRRTDVAASNGVLHVLDEVIVPPTLLDVATETSTLSELASAVMSASASVQAALAPDVLSGDAPVTVFAPVNAAFAVADLSGEDLDEVLAFHVLPGQVTADALRELPDGATLQTVQGGLLTVRSQGAIVELEDGRGNVVQVLDPDIRALNGVLHGVDGVLLPSVAP